MTLYKNLTVDSSAYIPLRRKTIRVGYWRWLEHPTPQFCVTYTNMLVSKNARNDLRYVTQILKLASPNPNPNTSQWNIGCVQSAMQISRVGHVHSIFLCCFHLRLEANANPVSSGIWALACHPLKSDPYHIMNRYPIKT